MPQEPTPAEIAADAIAERPDKASLILQTLHLLEEPCYEDALRHVLNMAPEDCERFLTKIAKSTTQPQPGKD